MQFRLKAVVGSVVIRRIPATSLFVKPSLLSSIQTAILALLFTATCLVNTAIAGEAVQPANNKTNKESTLSVYKVTKNIYGIVGPLANRTPENLGNNATFGLIVTGEGAVLIDPGGTYKGAKRLHGVIRGITDKPIKYVINTGGQDHRWLGNDYYHRQGATIIASKAAVKDQKQRLTDILIMLGNTAGDKAMKGTVERYADITFDKQYTFSLGGVDFEIHHPGPAHSPGDSFVWLPKQGVMFTGDIAYTERALSLMSFSNSRDWVMAYEAMAAHKPRHVVPGHGKPTTLDVTNKDTYEYLTLLRTEVSHFIDDGGIIQDVSKIDQSQYKYLENFDALKGRNVQKVYQEIEFE